MKFNVSNEVSLKELSEVVSIDGGYAFRSDEFVQNETPVIRIGNIVNGNVEIDYNIGYDIKNTNFEKYLIKNQDILIAMSGATTGKLAMYIRNNDALLNQRVGRFKVIDEGILDNNYLYYYLRSEFVQNKIKVMASGCAQPNISPKQLLSIYIPIPSLKTQKKIAEVLEKAEKALKKRKEAIRLIDELVKSRFIEMFGDPVINSKRWDSKDLGTLGYFKNGMNYKQSDSGFNIKFLGVGEFKYGNVINSANMLPTLELQEEPNEEYLLKKGDIVFVRSNGSKELVGRSVLVRELEEKTTYSGFCIRYRNQCEEVISDFLIQLFSDENFKKSFKKDSRGVNINNLNQQMLSSLKIILPPIELQNQFSDFFNQVDKLKFEMENSLKELENNFNSLMQRGFNSELFK